MLQDLLRHVNGLDEAEQIRTQAEAIEADRALLGDPDPVPPLCGELASILRSALQTKRQRLAAAREQALEMLDAVEAWQQLGEEQRDQILRTANLGPVPELQLGSEGAVLSALERLSLEDWEAQIQAAPSRAQSARDAAVRLVAPSTVTVRPKSATLRTVADAETYLEELRARIMENIKAGHPVII